MTESQRGLLDRRALGRALTRAARASVADVLHAQHQETAFPARVIGITGAPGSGKSTLVAQLAKHRLARAATLAVVAIDPTSPVSQGSVLGDRIRMETLAEDPRVYIRSLASRHAHDGLTDYIMEVLATLDRFGFNEVLIETVGVGQTEYGIRALADVELLVLTPGSGDHIQAMKAGIMETADVFIINKSDLPGAELMRAELLGVLQARRDGVPPLIRAQHGDGAAIAAISEAIDLELERSAPKRNAQETLRVRQRFRLQALIQRRLDESIASLPAHLWDATVAQLYRRIVDELRMGLPET